MKTQQILIPLHRARELKAGDEYANEKGLFRIESFGIELPVSHCILTTVTPLPALKLTLPEKP